MENKLAFGERGRGKSRRYGTARPSSDSYLPALCAKILDPTRRVSSLIPAHRPSSPFVHSARGIDTFDFRGELFLVPTSKSSPQSAVLGVGHDRSGTRKISLSFAHWPRYSWMSEAGHPNSAHQAYLAI
jgi:hypothetical protein